MEKSASKTIQLNGTMDVAITITRSITDIKGDPWECRPDETLHIERVSIEFINPSDGKKYTGTEIRVLDANGIFGKNDAPLIAKGAYACIPATGLYLSKSSYDQIKSAYDAVSSEAMFDEWQQYIDAKVAAKKAEKIADAEETVREAELELKYKGKLMTASEIRAWSINYNNVHNEGGSGYVPSHVSQESYDYAKSILETV